MLRFKKDPLKRGRSLIIALNAAFEEYTNPVLSELREQAAYLNGLDDRAPIVILSHRRDYKNYLAEVFSNDDGDDDGDDDGGD